MKKLPFDNKKYKDLQKKAIFEKIKEYDKLYIEVGGKLFDDKHASRVLPGFEPDVKMQIFREIKNNLEVIFCINSNDIIRKKTRGDNGLTYVEEVLRLINEMNNEGILAKNVMITFFKHHKDVEAFEAKCHSIGINTYRSYVIRNYPEATDKILSESGFGKNDYIPTTKKLILVSAPGANSGKLQTCFSQLYNDKMNGISSGYAKYETFPIWNLKVDHLVNVAYEMATADLCDENIIDPYYKSAYGKDATNYNRDVEAYPILSNILNQINGYEVYKSPTDMGINKAGFAIVDDKAVQEASMVEIERRYNKIMNDETSDDATRARAEELLKKAKELYSKL